jgi:hypothetical protein
MADNKTFGDLLSGKWDRVKDPFGSETEGLNWKAMGSYLGNMGGYSGGAPPPSYQVGRLGDRGASITPGVVPTGAPPGSPVNTMNAAANDPTLARALLGQFKKLLPQEPLTPAIGLGGRDPDAPNRKKEIAKMIIQGMI